MRATGWSGRGRGLGAILAGLVVVADLNGQTISAAASRWLTDPRVVDYRVSVSSYRAGPFTLFPFAQVTTQARSTDQLGGTTFGAATLGGAGADATVRLTATARPYLLAGASGGFLDLERSVGLGLWHAWSVGAGYELVRIGTAGIGVELRYQRLSRQAIAGVSLGVRIGKALGTAAGRPDPGTGVSPAATGREPGESRPELSVPVPPTSVGAAGAARTVLDAALDAMGTPYRWGGSDSNGFDCSGLIQFAYARAGIAVPRRSIDQAGFGMPIGTDFGRLAPGDILVFAKDPGGSASHVGLFLGEDRFIHSATGGTQISRLSGDDPTGRWWFARWIDSRRPQP